MQINRRNVAECRLILNPRKTRWILKMPSPKSSIVPSGVAERW